MSSRLLSMVSVVFAAAKRTAFFAAFASMLASAFVPVSAPASTPRLARGEAKSKSLKSKSSKRAVASAKKAATQAKTAVVGPSNKVAPAVRESPEESEVVLDEVPAPESNTEAPGDSAVDLNREFEKAASDFEDEKLLKTQKVPMVPEPERVSAPEMAVNNELGLRDVVVPPLAVDRAAKEYLPSAFEKRLYDRLLLDLKSMTYLQPIAGPEFPKAGLLMPDKANAQAAAYVAKSGVDGILKTQFGLEEINMDLISKTGRLVRSVNVRYRVGELEGKLADVNLSQRLIDALVLVLPYRGYVIKVDKSGESARINLGSAHGLKPGDKLGLFAFRGKTLESTRRTLLNVEVKQVVGPSEAVVVPERNPVFGGRGRIPESAFVSFGNPQKVNVSASDQSVVSGRWWVSFGGSVESYGADAAAKYESKVFRVNSTPFGQFGFGNDDIHARIGFGSAVSSSETLRFLDIQGTYSLYQYGAAQSALVVSGGARLLAVEVTPLPAMASALESTFVLAPVAELRYQYVPRGRVRLIGIGEVFYPVYTSGGDVGSLIFAFGGGLGGALQLAITERFGIEVYGRMRVLRRPVDGSSSVQDRQSSLGAGLILSF